MNRKIKNRILKAHHRAQSKEVNKSKHAAIRDWLILFEASPFTKAFVVLIALLSSVVTATSLWEQNRIWREERVERIESRVFRAKQVIDNSQSSNRDIKRAIDQIYRSGDSISGFDLSCKKFNRKWDEEEKTCENPIIIENIVIEGSEDKKINFENINFSGIIFVKPIFRYVSFVGSNFTGSSIINPIMSDVDFSRANFRSVSMTNIELYSNSGRNSWHSGKYLFQLDEEKIIFDGHTCISGISDTSLPIDKEEIRAIIGTSKLSEKENYCSEKLSEDHCRKKIDLCIIDTMYNMHLEIVKSDDKRKRAIDKYVFNKRINILDGCYISHHNFSSETLNLGSIFRPRKELSSCSEIKEEVFFDVLVSDYQGFYPRLDDIATLIGNKYYMFLAPNFRNPTTSRIQSSK